MNIAPARTAALATLERVRVRDAFGPETLAAVLSARQLDARDVGLATRLAYGTMQTIGTLDEVLDRFIERPNDVGAALRDVLRVATYELLFMRSPSHAVVHDAVEAAKHVNVHVAGFANAILRRVTDAAPDFPFGDPDTDDTVLARATGHPMWLAKRLIAAHGRELAARVMFDAGEPAPLYLRHVPFTGDFESAVSVLTADGADPIILDAPGAVLAQNASSAVRGEALARGRFIVSDLGAHAATLIASPKPGERIVDLASGRGGKTVMLQALAYEAGGEADVVAVDLHSFKGRVTTQRLEQLGVPGVRPLTADILDIFATPGAPRPRSADAVLLDAPCTGTGTLRRHPDKRWRLTPEDVPRLAELQLKMLRAASALVRPGGRLVYSTCSILPEENYAVVAAFLGSVDGEGFSLDSAAPFIPPALAEWVTDSGTFAALPLQGGPDGHFVARLLRTPA